MGHVESSDMGHCLFLKSTCDTGAPRPRVPRQGRAAPCTFDPVDELAGCLQPAPAAAGEASVTRSGRLVACRTGLTFPAVPPLTSAPSHPTPNYTPRPSPIPYHVPRLLKLNCRRMGPQKGLFSACGDTHPGLERRAWPHKLQDLTKLGPATKPK